MDYSISFCRTVGRKTNDDTILEQLNFIAGRATASNRGKGWDYTITKLSEPRKKKDGNWVFEYRIDFEKIGGRKGGETEYKQWQAIEAMAIQTGQHTKFAGNPWMQMIELTDKDLLGETSSSEPIDGDDKDKSRSPDVHIVSGFVPCKWSDILERVDFDRLLKDEDYLLSHDCFKEIYGLAPQIRTALSAIKTAAETNGKRRVHTAFWGHAGCGKTTVLLALEKLLGKDAVLRLDATGTTRAGIERMVFSDFRQGFPPIVYAEEIEKAPEDGLKVWLGALDDRGEVRKVNFKQQEVRSIQIVFFCTVNNKSLFDRMMGSDGKEHGALSSRCVNQLYFPRPSDETLRRILKREIEKNGGKEKWIEPCIQLAKDLGENDKPITDPRIVMSFLAGGDRLLTKEYQKDRIAIHRAEIDYKKEGI